MSLFQKQQAFRLDEIRRRQTIRIHPARKIRTIKFGLVDSDSLHLFPNVDASRLSNG